MRDSSSTLNSSTESNKEFKPICVGKNCSNDGTNLVKIIYIHTNLWFCDTCKLDLIKLGLVEEEV